MNVYAFTLPTVLVSASALAAQSYTVDSNHTLPVFEVNHLGFSTQRGRFDKTQGKIVLDPAKQAGSVDITIDAGSIDMGQTKWNDHLKSPDFFNVARFPSITFKSDRLIFQNGVPVSAEGTLTLLGVSRPVTLAIHRFACGINPINQKALCGADVTATLQRSEFGMTKYLPAVSDEVTALIPVEAYKD